VEGVAADPQYLDIFVPPGQRQAILKLRPRANAFCLCIHGIGDVSRRLESASGPDGASGNAPMLRQCTTSVTTHWCCSIAGTN